MIIAFSLLVLLGSVADGSLLVGNSDIARAFVNNVRDVQVDSSIYKNSDKRVTRCSFNKNGKMIKTENISSAANRGGSDRLHEECLRLYRSYQDDITLDVGIAAITLANFIKEFGMSDNRSVLKTLEHAVELAKRKVRRNDLRQYNTNTFLNPTDFRVQMLLSDLAASDYNGPVHQFSVPESFESFWKADFAPYDERKIDRLLRGISYF